MRKGSGILNKMINNLSFELHIPGYRCVLTYSQNDTRDLLTSNIYVIFLGAADLVRNYRNLLLVEIEGSIRSTKLVNSTTSALVRTETIWTPDTQLIGFSLRELGNASLLRTLV